MASCQKDFALRLGCSDLFGDDDHLEVALDAGLVKFTFLLLCAPVRDNAARHAGKRFKKRQHIIEQIPAIPVMVLIKFNERVRLGIRESLAVSREQFANTPSPLLLKQDPPGKKRPIVFLAEKTPQPAEFGQGVTPFEQIAVSRQQLMRCGGLC